MGLVAGCFVLFTGFLHDGNGEFWGVEQVVGLGEAESQVVHELAAEFVVLFADFSERGFCFLGDALGEGEGLETVCWRIA